MNHDTVLGKSAKGLEAIATRAHGLSPRLRTLLIMVDGKRRVADLLPLAAGLGDPGQLLTQLQQEGFVDVLTTPLAVASPSNVVLPPAVAVPTPTSLPEVSLAEAKRFAVRQLTDLLGPSAEMLCLRIEGARSVGDFSDNVQRARILVRNVRGEGMAERFASAIESHSPSMQH